MLKAAPSARVARFGVFELDIEAGELRKQGVKLRLQKQPFDVLQRLLESPGEVVTREELRQKVWPNNTFVDFDQGLNNSIQRIRDVLGDSAQSPRFVETIPKRGYRFLGPVSFPRAEPGQTSSRTEARRPRLRQLQLTLVLLLILICVIITAFGLWSARQGPSLIQIHALAVLPLENLSGDPTQEFLADGITDELITEVAHLRPLRVISRTSVMRYKGTRKPLPEIAKELNVDAVLEGSILRSGQQVRVTAQLIEARTDTHVWSGEYTREMRDIISLQRGVTDEIAHQIRLHLLPAQQRQLLTPQPVNPDAYDAFLRGRTSLDQMTPATGRAAAQYFEKAIELDPNFAPPYVFLADSLVLAGGSDNSRKDVPRARSLLAKALELDPTLSTAHSRLGIILLEWDWDWQGAEREIKWSLELNPNDRQNHYAYARYLQVMRHREEALAESDRTLEIDPLSPRVIRLKASILSILGRYDEADRLYQKALELDPVFKRAQGDMTWNKMRAAFRVQNYAAVDLMVRGLLSQAEGDVDVVTHGKEASDSRTALADLKAILRQRRGLGDLERACIYSLLGDHEDAMEWLERAHTKHLQYFVFALTSSDFDSLRPDPRYQALMRRINFPP